MLKWFLLLTAVFGCGYSIYNYYMKTTTDVKAPTSGDYSKGNVVMEHKSEALTRTFTYFKPENLISDPALVFVLHGSRGTGDKVRFQSGYQYDYLAEKTGEFITVYPNGYQNHWNDCRASASYAANTENIDDVAFFEQMISYFVEKYQINRDRVFVTGFSNGGQMVYRLAFEVPTGFTAFAAIAANLPIEENLSCEKSQQGVSIAIFNGTEDPINPYHGGVVNVYGNKSRGSVVSTLSTIEYWATLANLTVKSEINLANNNDGTAVIKTIWTNSASQESKPNQVRLYTLKGSGHVMPSKVVNFARILGENSTSIEGAAEVWSFFQDVSKLNAKNKGNNEIN